MKVDQVVYQAQESLINQFTCAQHDIALYYGSLPQTRVPL